MMGDAFMPTKSFSEIKSDGALVVKNFMMKTHPFNSYKLFEILQEQYFYNSL